MNKHEMELFKEFLAFQKYKESETQPPTKKRKKKRNKYTLRDDGFYQTSVTVGYDNATGKPIKTYIYAKTIGELEQKKARIIIDKSNGVQLDKQKNMTVKQFRTRWFETKKIKLGLNGTNTIKMYNSIFNNYFCVIDDLAVADVTKEMLQDIINKNSDKPRQCQKIKLVFNEIFKSMVNEQILTFNPASILSIPKYKAPKKRNLTKDEDTLSEISDFTDRERAFIYLIKYFGLRKEEALAVSKSDFDFNKNIIHIHSAVIFNENQPVYKDTKNTDSRIIPIMPNVRDFFIRYTNNIATEKLIVNRQNGSHITNQGYNSMWKHIKKQMTEKGRELNLKIGADLSAHIFRHNYAYMLMDAGIDMKERQYLLGHKTIAMTMDIYTHIEENKMKAAGLLEKYSESKKDF